VIQAYFVLEDFHQNRLDVLLHNCGVEAKLNPRVLHDRAQKLHIAFPKVVVVPFMLEEFNKSLPFRISSLFIILLWLDEINHFISSMDQAAIDIHQDENGWELCFDESINVNTYRIQEVLIGLFLLCGGQESDE